jgi:hypothetical protein
MPSGKSAARESFPGVLGANGTIDLSGQGSKPPSRPASGRPSGDAWIVDRARRSLMPAPITEENSPGDGDEDGRLDLQRELADRFALGDFAGALNAAELLLGEDPDDTSAAHYASSARERLEERYTTRIGSLDYIFNRTVPEAKVKWLGLDPQAAFLLSLSDGQTTVAEVLELCGMGRLQAMRVFTELLEAKAIERVA